MKDLTIKITESTVGNFTGHIEEVKGCVVSADTAIECIKQVAISYQIKVLHGKGEEMPEDVNYLQRSLELRAQVVELEAELEGAENHQINTEAEKDAEISALKQFIRFLTRKWD